MYQTCLDANPGKLVAGDDCGWAIGGKGKEQGTAWREWILVTKKHASSDPPFSTHPALFLDLCQKNS